MNFRNISSWCIRNPVGPIVLFVGLMLAGLVVIRSNAGQQRAGHRLPGSIVSVSQPAPLRTRWRHRSLSGSNPRCEESRVVDEINSSITEGNSTTFVSFALGTPTDRAVNDVRNAVAQIRSNLPDGILEPQITRVDAEDEPIMVMAAGTTDMTLEQLSWYIDNNISKRLLGVEGIAAVSRGGGVDRTIRVILDPAALQAQGITAAQVNQQLRQSNFNGAGGRAEIAGSEQSVRVLGNARDAYQLSQTEIALPGGRFVRLTDLGEVKDASSEQRTLTKMNGRQVVTFYVQRAKGSSEVTAYNAGMAELKKLEKEDPRVRFSEIFNRVGLYEGTISFGDGGPRRRCRPRSSGRAALPPRHSRDRYLRPRNPNVRHPGLLVHEPDGHHHELHVDHGDGPGRRRVGGRRDRRDRKYRPTHAHGQVRLPGFARCRG
jgi:hypothetical protein